MTKGSTCLDEYARRMLRGAVTMYTDRGPNGCPRVTGNRIGPCAGADPLHTLYLGLQSKQKNISPFKKR
jgi:hypothetical protein